MITREEFPYLQELVINDAYAVKNLRVPIFEPGQQFKHLILTGRNGSGKTTVSRGLYPKLNSIYNDSYRNIILTQDGKISDSLNADKNISAYLAVNGLSISSLEFQKRFSKSIISFFEATRKVQVLDVSSVLREDSMDERIKGGHPMPGSPSELFKQYLVNKKIFQVFDTIEGNINSAENQSAFFSKLESNLGQIFSDSALKLEFVRENFEFYISLSDGRRFTFNQLSAGYSAFLSILTDLLVRIDLLRKQASDYSYDPCGFVLIDEPETHLHLEMQYQILPLLTSLFPNLQFIVATHSPAVASSIKNATVFDLSTGKALGDSAAGSSFSELMQTHFGLENEYSNVADKILEEVAEIGEMSDRVAARERLQRLLNEQGKYMSPVLRLDVQAHLLHLQREQAA